MTSTTPNPALPVEAVLAELVAALSAGPGAVLVAPPGSGKTTRVPLALLDAPWLAGQRIVMLEPRRLAASNAARYLASRLGGEVGGTVGYTIRYERRVSPRTRLEVVTEGVLARRLQNDPELAGTGLVIFDEFHERSLDADLALALCRDVQSALRPDLRLLVMSATLDGAAVAGALGGVPVIRCEGRSFPVAIEHLPVDPPGPLTVATAAAIRRALAATAGDLLAFLPGAGEIRRCAALLHDLADVDLRPLYGELPFAEQEWAILPGSRRRVVLATNVAETSLTIEGITAVVDSGYERRARFDPQSGSTLLELTRISQASAAQRAGRAGRLAPGRCYRLWSVGTHGALLPAAPPEIRQADLAGLALELARWGAGDGRDLAWLDPPPAGALHGARHLLRQLDLLDGQGRLTAAGGEAAELPAHPRLAALLLAARDAGETALGCELAALLGERELFPAEWRPAHPAADDFAERLALLHRASRSDPRLAAVRRAADFWRRRLGAPPGPAGSDLSALPLLLAAAFPDRIAQRRSGSGDRYLLASGRGARLGPRSAVPRPELLVAAGVRGLAGDEAEITLAAALSREELIVCRPDVREWRRAARWDEAEGRVVGREVQGCGALVLRERPAAVSDAEARELLLDWLRRAGPGVLPWTEEARQYRGRLACLRRNFPDAGWPEVSDTALQEDIDAWLGPWLAGVRSRQELARLKLADALAGWVGGRGREVERLAPERLAVPSGSRIRLDYTAGEQPVLAAKLQELFGLAATPCVADGRQPVLIHLLSPAGRPLAVTADLRSFWDSVYPEVRREMRGRYPRHPWPDDPWSAEATRRAKPRG